MDYDIYSCKNENFLLKVCFRNVIAMSKYIKSQAIIFERTFSLVDLSLKEEFFLDSVIEISRGMISVYIKSKEIL
jgi:hypothetical protein